MAVFRYRGTRAEFLADLHRLTATLAGKLPDTTGAVRGLQLRMGTELLSQVKQAYITKSTGGTDELGIRWPELSPVTLLLRRTGGQRKTKSPAKQTPAQRQRLREAERLIYRALTSSTPEAVRTRRRALKILNRQYDQGTISKTRYQTTLKRLEGRLKDDAAKKLAGQLAQAAILRDTGVLLNSLSPGTSNTQQVLEAPPGGVIVGTNVPYAKYHQSPLPRRLRRDGTPVLPRRQFLPDEGRPIPKRWWDAMTGKLMSGVNSAAFWKLFAGSRVR